MEILIAVVLFVELEFANHYLKGIRDELKRMKGGAE